MTQHADTGKTMNFCPAFTNPEGGTGCLAAEMTKDVRELKGAVNGVPASPGVERQPGMMEILIGFITEYRAERARQWKRSDKLALIGILLVLLAWPSAKVWVFVVDVYHVTQEWHALHKSEIEQRKIVAPPTRGRVDTAQTTLDTMNRPLHKER
jgi:hypothetical protein